ncbi:MAG: hypothetical protein IJ841_05705 [Prevotella sp.]|nr:hypothetical protein [Prevotella sp.]
MDYKYIEQLLERYFECETSLHEEQILRSFFAQDEQEVPAELRQYRPLFQALQQDDVLGDDFDERLLALTQEPKTVKARTISLSERLRPLFRAAAIVAVVLTLGNAINVSLQREQPASDEINYAAYKDTYDDPSMAYDQVEDALQLLSEGYNMAAMADSMAVDSILSRVE